MRIGIDGRKIPGARTLGPLGILEYAHSLGMEGVFFRTLLDMSPDLDVGLLADIRALANELGLYLEAGLGKVNPYAMGEAPELRALGDGDTLKGFRRMIEAGAAIGCNELWAATANRQPLPGYRSYDRFRTDVTWGEQLNATARFLNLLTPVLAACGAHINVETHEEITSFEVVRLVESVGADTLGIVYDTGNGLHRGEDPVAVARRVAPYVRQSHVKDVILVLDPEGVTLQARPIGEGSVDFHQVLPILAAANPDLHLTMENRQPDENVAATYPAFGAARRPTVTGTLVEIFDTNWQAGHPDLTAAELAAYVRLALEGSHRIAKGEIATVEAVATDPFGHDQAIEFLQRGAAHLRVVLEGFQRVTLSA
ncbi:MAG: sugar phosphate isomerase/epimerase [Actinomycetota bacterium]|nr:sugar phosphate isomerase/epimerase [Actinomycetota bacterium]